jgi:rod shape-determining protein MreC
LVWYIIFSLFLMSLDYFEVLSPVKNAVDPLVLSIKKNVYNINLITGNFTSLVMQYSSIKKIAEEREQFFKENTRLMLENNFLKNENEKMRSQLLAPLPSAYEFIPAQIIGMTHFMELDVGEVSGVKTGMTVVDGINFIGKVNSVSNYRSEIIMPTDANISIPAKTGRGVKGYINGQFGNKITLTKVLQKDPLFLDDQVFTSGEDNYPPNLLIGKISHIEVNDVSVYKQAEVNSVVDYNKEKLVFIISNR